MGCAENKKETIRANSESSIMKHNIPTVSLKLFRCYICIVLDICALGLIESVYFGVVVSLSSFAGCAMTQLFFCIQGKPMLSMSVDDQPTHKYYSIQRE